MRLINEGDREGLPPAPSADLLSLIFFQNRHRTTPPSLVARSFARRSQPRNPANPKKKEEKEMRQLELILEYLLNVRRP
jgi:hypothetical protein